MHTKVRRYSPSELDFFSYAVQMILATFRPKSSLVGSGRGTIPDEDDEDTDNEHNHSKSDKDNDTDKSLVGWLYVGSHNFTPSAWGTLSGTSNKPSLSVSNTYPLFEVREMLMTFSRCIEHELRNGRCPALEEREGNRRHCLLGETGS